MTLFLSKGLVLGEGARSLKIEKVTHELIYVRGGQDGNPLRFIPVCLVKSLIYAIKDNKITIHDISRKYRSEKNLPHLFEELDLGYDKYILGYDSTIQKICEYVLENSNSHELKQNLGSAQQLSKPFLLLAGISGTGKTRFVREQAKETNTGKYDNYCLVPVRPDWHDPSELLGYVSRLGTQPRYVVTDALRFIVRAWKEIITKIVFDKSKVPVDFRSKRSDKLHEIPPYWLCLDEMNIAPVEQYFSDYLSVLETISWNNPETLDGSGLDYTYECDPLIKGEILTALDSGITNSNKPSDVLASELDLDLSKESDRNIWSYFLKNGIAIPFNLIVVGTVNMDETTHGFSRKVIDRALSFDFGEFFPNIFDDFFSPTNCNKRLSYPIWSNASKADLANTVDADGSKTVAFLSAVNSVLKNTPFELAFRALNELLLAVASCQPQDDLTLKAVWDDFMMCKVLPRIEGDTDKLTTSDGKALLAELGTVLADQLAPIWLASETDEANQRPDLYREKIVADGATNEEKILAIPCRSKAKLTWMNDRLANATFTSFWP